MAGQSESLRPSSHSVFPNQAFSKHMRERQERGIDRKASKAERRRMEDEQFVQAWITKQFELNLAPEKRFKLALERENDEDIQLLFINGDDFEAFGYRVDRFTFSVTDQKAA